MPGQRSTSAAGEVSLEVGQPFNPYGLFHGIFIPEALARATGISPGPKIVFGRLARFAGENGECYPSVRVLAAEIGASERQTQRYLAELERKQLIRRVPRVSESGQTSNVFEFLWHSIFKQAVTRMTPRGVTHVSPEGVTDVSPKESPSEDSQSEDRNIDLDYQSTNRKKRDSRLGSVGVASKCKHYPELREALADYMTTRDEKERVYPPDRLVVDVMDAAAGATEEEVIRCLRYLREERGLAPGTKHGPRHFSWFKTVVADYMSGRPHCTLARNGRTKPGGAKEFMTWFEQEFWAEWPRKQGKKRATKAAMKIYEKRGLEFMRAMVVPALLKQKAPGGRLAPASGPEFIPYPEKWLNGEEWENEENSGATEGAPIKAAFHKPWQGFKETEGNAD